MNISAVIVTHNRIELLKHCISLVRTQARRPNSIVVVNNNSSDGTQVWLDQQPDIRSICQGDSGSAGGFNTGIRTAFETGADWVWCMDDDCEPCPDALEKLVAEAVRDPSTRVFNSVVVSTSNSNAIAFGYHHGFNIRLRQSGRCYYRLDELTQAVGLGAVDGLTQFYLSTMIARDVVDCVGLPEPALFIRGDEVDYVLRIQEAGYRTATVTSSVARHPTPLTKMVFGRRVTWESLRGEKLYYIARNQLINDELHYGRPITSVRCAKRVAKLLIRIVLVDGIRAAFMAIGTLAKGVRDAKPLMARLRVARCDRSPSIRSNEAQSICNQ